MRQDNKQSAQGVPLSWRLFDLFFVITYLLVFVIVLVVFVARCNKILPSEFVQLKQTVCPAVGSLEPAMGDALTTYREWVDKVYNTKVSLAVTCAHRMNTFIVGPLSLYLAYAFFVGKDCKNLALIHAMTMFYGMVIQDTIGWHAILDRHVHIVGAEAQTFFMVTFGFATVFPIVVLMRIWPARPFSMEEYYQQQQIGLLDSCLNYVGMLACWCWLFGSLIFYYEFCVKNVALAQGMPSVFDHSNEVWKQTAPHRDALMKQAAPHIDTANQLIDEYAKVGKEAVSGLGDKTVEYLKQLGGN